MNSGISISKLLVAALAVTQPSLQAKAQDGTNSSSTEDNAVSGPVQGEGIGRFVPMPEEVTNFLRELIKDADADTLIQEALKITKKLTCPAKSQVRHMPDIALGLNLEAKNRLDFSRTDSDPGLDLIGRTSVRFAHRADQLARNNMPWVQHVHKQETILIQTAGNNWSWKPSIATEIPSAPTYAKPTFRVLVTFPPPGLDEVSPVATCLYAADEQYGIMAEIDHVVLHINPNNGSVPFGKNIQSGEYSDVVSGNGAEDENILNPRAVTVDKSVLSAEIEYDLTTRALKINSVVLLVKFSNGHNAQSVAAIKKEIGNDGYLLADGYLSGGPYLYPQSTYVAWKHAEPAPKDVSPTGSQLTISRIMPSPP